MKRIAVQIIRLMAGLIGAFFVGVTIVGTYEWINVLFIEVDGKMWLDWPIMFSSVGISISGAIFVSAVFFLFFGFQKILIQNVLNWSLVMCVISLVSYSIISVAYELHQVDSSFLDGSILLPIFVVFGMAFIRYLVVYLSNRFDLYLKVK